MSEPDPSQRAPFDRRAVRLHRDRAASTVGRVAAVLDEAAERLVERLDDVTRRFDRALDLGGRGATARRLRARGIETVSLDLSAAMLAADAGAVRSAVAGDEERLPFADGSFDLVVAGLDLHWVNDLPGALVQIRRCLAPDGLLLASVPVLDTLSPLRRALIEAETALRGGVAPRVSPFPELRDCAALLQRAGFALPVCDLETVALGYATPLALLRDLRAAGEANALALRDRTVPPRALFPLALSRLESGRDGPASGAPIGISLRMAMLTAWAPAPTQPRPLERGRFEVPLARALAAPPPGPPPPEPDAPPAPA